MNIKIIYVGLAIVGLFIGNSYAEEIKTDDTIGVACAKDAKICPDGTSVGRDPYNNCEFNPCPFEIVCTDDVKICPDGSSVVRSRYNNCEFEPCPSEIVCTDDVKTCPDGSVVVRDPYNNCAFEPCAY